MDKGQTRINCRMCHRKEKQPRAETFVVGALPISTCLPKVIILCRKSPVTIPLPAEGSKLGTPGRDQPRWTRGRSGSFRCSTLQFSSQISLLGKQWALQSGRTAFIPGSHIPCIHLIRIKPFHTLWLLKMAQYTPSTQRHVLTGPYIPSLRITLSSQYSLFLIAPFKIQKSFPWTSHYSSQSTIRCAVLKVLLKGAWALSFERPCPLPEAAMFRKPSGLSMETQEGVGPGYKKDRKTTCQPAISEARQTLPPTGNEG